MLCLPDSSLFHQKHQGSLISENHISVLKVIYNTLSDEPLSSMHGRDVECAVCFTQLQESIQLMISQTAVCPTEPGWSTIYTGYLMSSRDSPSETLNGDTLSHSHSEYICIDKLHPLGSGSANSDAQLHHVYYHQDCKAETTSLDCNSKPSEVLTCAVCSYSLPSTQT